MVFVCFDVVLILWGVSYCFVGWFGIGLLLLIVLVWYFICKQLFSVGALLFSVSWIVVVCLGLVFVFCFV